jgi:hypothetical protein
MRRLMSSTIARALSPALLLLVVMMVGCNNENERVLGVCDKTPPLAGAIIPGCGATNVALNQTLRATFTEPMDPSTITATTILLAGPGGTPVSGTVTYVPATITATFTPSSNLAPNTTYTYTIRGGATGVADPAGNRLATNFECAFTTLLSQDTTRPTVASTDPSNGATDVLLDKAASGSPAAVPGTAPGTTSEKALGKIITATFSKAMDPLTITSSTFLLTGPGATPVPGSVTYAGPSFTATFMSAHNLLPHTTYTGTITTGAADPAGNALASNYVWVFTTGAELDTNPPTVIFTDPVNNATGVALNKKIAATFSEAMAPSSITTTTFTLWHGTTSVTGTVTYAGTTALFTPASALSPNTAYTATIGTNATDTAGNELASHYVWNFTTGATPDIAPPTVDSTDPVNSTTGAALNVTIEATFSEAMDPATITTTTFTLRQGTTPIAGAVTYAGATALFRPASPLTASTVYTATIGTGAEDLAGNALLSSYTWSFTTAAAPDVLPPTLISTDPANGAIGVVLTKIVTAVFSEAMDRSTITTATVLVTGLGGASVTGTLSYASGTRTVTFAPSSQLAANTTYTGTIRGGSTGTRDLAGNPLAGNYVWVFTTGATPDVTPPTVIATDPLNNATSVALNKKIAATFSKAMNASTITTTTFTLRHGTTPVSGAVSYSGTTALFTPAGALAPNTAYTATITTGAMDTAGNGIESAYVWNFTTGSAPDTTAPTLVSRDPTSGATGVPLNTTIEGTFSEAMDPSTITTTTFGLRQGTTPVEGAVTYAGTTALFTPAGPLAATTVYTVTVSTGAEDLAGNALLTTYTWTFTTAAAPDLLRPTVISTDPANGATGVTLSKIITAVFSEAMDQASITTATVRVTGLGGASVTGTVGYASDTRTATFSPSSQLAANTTYTGTIRGGATGARDLAGNSLASNYVWTFTTGVTPDITLPTVISTDPVNHASGVALNKKISATFSEVMNAATITTTTFTLRHGATSVTGSVTYLGTTALFTPASALVAGTAYTATITTGAMDTAGNALAGAYVWNFTTGAEPDITSPTVIFTDPVNHATGVATNTTIEATFSEAMDPSTITAGTFTLLHGSTSVSGAVGYAGTTALFTPAGPLADNTVYTATISSGAQDLAGNALTTYTWTFTTAAALDVLPPTVLSTDPSNGAIDVALNKIITARFSEAMDQSTITTATVRLTGLGGASVTGTVSYASGTNTVTFAPASTFAAHTTYTGTIKGGGTGAKDLAGNPVVSDYVWTFTTLDAPGPSGQAPVNLGTASRFAILSNSAITNIPTSAITGDVGISPGARSSITGLTLPEVTGVIYAADDADPVPAMLIAAKTDARNAYLDAVAAVRGTPTPISGNINGLTLVPGLYESGTSIEISPGGILYLDGQGNSSAVFVIRSATSITTESTSQVVLTGSAQAKNIFWAAGSAVTLGTNSVMKGTVIACTSISIQTGARLDGRALIQSAAAGQVSLDHSTIVRPS